MASTDHALWSASASERNFACPGALALTKDLPEDTSEAADWGTVCHAVSEDCLFSTNKQPSDFLGERRKGKVYEFEVDDEMVDCADQYVSYCRGRVAKYKAETGENALIFVEENFSLADLKPPFDAGGTGDFVIIFPRWKLIEIVDLKTGRGVIVEVKGNPQERTYALGALLRHPGHDIEKVMCTIVQPRAPHKDGRIRSDTFHVADLVEWTVELLGAMANSFQAAQTVGDVSDAEWNATFLHPGDHCAKTFCKAQSFCPALKQKALDVVGVWFDELDQPRLATNQPDESPDERAKTLDLLDMIEGWVQAKRAAEHAKAKAGDLPTGYILVETQGREKWLDGVEEQVIGAAVLAGLPDAKYLNPAKLRTPKQVRDALKGKAAEVAGLSHTPITGTNLVRANTTNRPAIASPVERFFEPSTN